MAVVDVGEVVSNLQGKTIKSVTIKDLEIGKRRNQSKILTFSSETMRGIRCSLISAWEQKTDNGYHKISLTPLVRCRQKRSHILTTRKETSLVKPGRGRPDEEIFLGWVLS